MNPNEVNIEYVNKEKGFQPFQVYNPNFFNPISKKRNNNFYYTIKALDCAMTYKNNFTDYEDIESIHYEVKKNDINYNLSYNFMVKVENYYHIVEEDKEDCAMIIYNEEKSKDMPLIIIENIPHPSNFNESYYIYLFTYESSFSGIFVDIKFNNESLSKTKENPSININIKIEGKEIENKENIVNDYFFIYKNKLKKIQI